jgi:hypothetical protein
MQLFTRILLLLLATTWIFDWAPDYPVESSNYLL